MIKVIVKRDGSKEDFNPTKINGWGEWSAKTLGGSVDWAGAVLHVVSTQPEEVTSEQLQEALINYHLDKRTWEDNRMAGRLYASLIYKKCGYGKKKPTVKKLHEKLQSIGMMVKLNYTDAEYEQVEKLIKHDLDFKASHYELHQLRLKYALRNKTTGEEYESSQFVYMRMAMALAETSKPEEKMNDVAKWYEHLSHKRLNAPTPNFVNLGTELNGYASCCLYTTKDTVASLACGDHIALMMTAMSAGIGSHIKTRSIGDSVRNGLIEHQGKIGYYRSLVGAIGANLQNGRGGAATVFYTAYDPEVEMIQKLKNPMTPEAKKVRGCDYAFSFNKFIARKAAKNEDVVLFSYKDAPDLYEAMYSKDSNLFEALYNKFVAANPTAKSTSARSVVLGALNEGIETGRHYLANMEAINTHTPFKEQINSSNLC